jgi:hypothetical protein
MKKDMNKHEPENNQNPVEYACLSLRKNVTLLFADKAEISNISNVIIHYTGCEQIYSLKFEWWTTSAKESHADVPLNTHAGLGGNL